MKTGIVTPREVAAVAVSLALHAALVTSAPRAPPVLAGHSTLEATVKAARLPGPRRCLGRSGTSPRCPPSGADVRAKAARCAEC
ncbi:MAG: hypothetical protein IAE78_28785 [Myxococcus sp.]|nr:hypothetical protein [Myxococcus sp.]